MIKKIYYQYISENNAIIISHPSQSTFQIGRLFNIKLPVIDNLESHKRVDHKIEIVHAPSNRIIKGKAIVQQAIAKLKTARFDFKFNLIENLPVGELLKILKRADILVDQPGDTYGTLTLEGCASGCCVISGLEKIGKYYPNSPIIPFEPHSEYLFEQPKFLLENEEIMTEKKHSCHKFWDENYNPKLFEKYIDDLIDGSAPSFLPRDNQKYLK